MRHTQSTKGDGMAAPVNAGDHLIVIRPVENGQFSAEPIGIPEIHVTAPTAQAALEEVRQKLSNWPGQVHWVHAVSSSVPPGAGHARNDPDHQAYLDEIERYRREVEARECPSSSSIPTT
jgi:hypothetical protein